MTDPSLKREHAPRLALSVLTGLMLGFSFPPFPLGILACFGLVPLLVVISGVLRTRTALWYVYVALLVFHVITVNWTGGYAHGNDPYMMIAGAVTMLVHPLFYFIPFGIFLFVRRRLGEPLALGVFPFAWVAYEFSHSLSEWSFPWLTLGNSQTYDIARVQFITLTGVFGLSFWILLMNLVAYVFVAGLLRQKFHVRSATTAFHLAVIVLLYALPAIHGSFVLSRPEALPGARTGGGTVEALPGARTGGGTVRALPDARTHGGTVRALPDARTDGGTVRALPDVRTHGDTVETLPDVRTHGDTVGILPGARTLGGTVETLPDARTLGGTVEALPGARTLGGTVEILPGARTGGGTVRVGIVQSNIDPWDKWNRSGYGTMGLYQDMTDRLMDSLGENHPDIVIWPETAVPFDVLGGMNSDLLALLRTNSTRWGAGILTGFPRRVAYHDSTTTPRSARREKGTGTRYDWFNAAVFVPAVAGDVRWYGKMKMVPFAERIPYAGIFSFFDFLRWDVGIGGWQIGPDTTVFTDPRTGARFNTIICYESTYPGFVTAFVRKGAEFLTLITIDSWWGRMSGAYQHQQIAILRAIENRRWLVRCAVGGISCYIDPYGRVYDRTELFTTATLCRTIERRTDLTMYSRHGDWLGEICVWVSLTLLAAGAGRNFLRKKWTQKETD
jgi:apolipoprotein N-acyltransferase